jgi:hypothetical protein
LGNSIKQDHEKIVSVQAPFESEKSKMLGTVVLNDARKSVLSDSALRYVINQQVPICSTLTPHSAPSVHFLFYMTASSTLL